MGIKEKELEDLILNLLDRSSAMQNKVRSICSATQGTSASYPAETAMSDSKTGFFDKRKIASLESNIEQLKRQLSQSQAECQQAASRIQEYKSSSVQLQAQCNNLESENKRLSDYKARLENELKKASAELDACTKRLNDLEREYQRMQENEQALSASLAKANENVQKLKERFSNPVILLDRYRTLSTTIRTGLSDVICDKDEILFIASCSTSDHLKAIWTYTKKLAGSNGDANSVEVLKDIFDYFFEIFNSSLREPMYARDSVEVGYSFDDDKYDRCAGSATSGKITQVVLRGYKSVNTGAIICRSLVRV